MRDHLFKLWGALLCVATMVFLVVLVIAAGTNPAERSASEPWLLGSLALLAIGFLSMLVHLHLTTRLTEEEARTWHRRMWIGLVLAGVYFLRLAPRGKRRPSAPHPHLAP